MSDFNDFLSELEAGSTVKTIAKVVVTVVVIIVLGGILFQLGAYKNSNSKLWLVEYPSGKMVVWTSNGIYPKLFAREEEYPKSTSVVATKAAGLNATIPGGTIKTMLGDGTVVLASGYARFSYPQDLTSLKKFSNDYGDGKDVLKELLNPEVERAVEATAPLFIADDVITEKKGEINTVIQDQLINGLYQAEKKVIVTTDSLGNVISTEYRTVPKVDPVTRQILRQDLEPDDPNTNSVLAHYGFTIMGADFTFEIADSLVNRRFEQKKDLTNEGEVQKETESTYRKQIPMVQAEFARKIQQETNEQEMKFARLRESLVRDRNVALIQAEQVLETAINTCAKSEQEKAKIIINAKADAEQRRLKQAATHNIELKQQAFIEIMGFYQPVFEAIRAPAIASANLAMIVDQFYRAVMAEVEKDLNFHPEITQ